MMVHFSGLDHDEWDDDELIILIIIYFGGTLHGMLR